MNTAILICMDCNEPLPVNPSLPETVIKCSTCKVDWECESIIPAKPKPDLTPKPRTNDATPSCFNHADNESEAECSCGKLLCKVCAFYSYGKAQCANCYTSHKQNPDLKAVRIVRYDWMASSAIGLTFITLGLATPLVIYFMFRYLTTQENALYQGKTSSFIRLMVSLAIVLLIDGSIITFLIIDQHPARD